MSQCTYTLDPTDNHQAALDASWSCPHEAYDDGEGESHDHCIFHMSPDERSKHGIDPETVIDRIEVNLQKEDNHVNEYVGAHLPELSFAFDELDGSTNHPLNLEYATVEGLDLTRAEVRQGIDLSHATIASFSAEDAVVYGDFEAHHANFLETVNAEEATFIRNAYFKRATFQQAANLNEAVFEDECSFVGATFEEMAAFKGTTFSGQSHDIGNNADFTDATFRQAAEFHHANFEYVTFEDARFKDRANFDHAAFDGDALFHDAIFENIAVFTESRFAEDGGFKRTHFEKEATFKGAEFLGGSRAIDDDVSFEDAEFLGNASFEFSKFRTANFDDVTFRAEAVFNNTHFISHGEFDNATFHGLLTFQGAEFDRNSSFTGSVFKNEADFDEAEFHGDVNFSDTTFESEAVFRGAEFLGDARHLNDNVVFDNATFKGDADFSNAMFRTASFRKTMFAATCNFTESEFNEEVEFQIIPNGSTVYVNLTGATIAGGSIVQDASAAVLYDMTEGTVGDVDLGSEAHGTRYELLDHFRFCRTRFDGFEFSNHYDYFERNNWNIHSFADGSLDVEYAVPMTHANIEQTYNNAAGNASDNSEKKAARQFSVKRHRYSRYKNKEMALDDTEPLGLGSRIQKLVGAGLNFFLDVTCGYRTRFLRIAAITFLVIPFVFAVLYSLGGPFQTTAGSIQSGNALSAFAQNLHFSYITFTTVGYGNNGPVGAWAATLTAIQGSLNVMFGVLFTATFLGRFLDF